jgi:hypothetical protein
MTVVDMAPYNELWDCKIILPPDKTRNGRKARADELLKMARDNFRNHEIMSEGEGRWTIAHKYTDPGKWQGKWRSDFLAEIIVCRVGVFVSGDIDSVIFAGGDRGVTPEAMVGWVGRHRDVDSYLLQKASMGFNDSTRNPAEAFDEDVAIEQMQDRAFEVYQTICENVVEEFNDRDKCYLLLFSGVSAKDIPDELPEVLVAFNDKTGRIECEDQEVLQRLLWVVGQRIANNKELQAWATAIIALRNGESHQLVFDELYLDLNRAHVCDAWEYVEDLGVVTNSRVYYAHAACAKLCELLDARKAASEVHTEDAP